VDPRRRRGRRRTVRHDHRPRLPHPEPAPPLRLAGLPARTTPAPAQLRAGEGPVPAPVPVGSRLRSHVRFGEVRTCGGKQLVVEHTVEIEGHDKPRASPRTSCCCSPEPQLDPVDHQVARLVRRRVGLTSYPPSRRPERGRSAPARR
jgi:hypothetical protein